MACLGDIIFCGWKSLNAHYHQIPSSPPNVLMPGIGLWLFHITWMLQILWSTFSGMISEHGMRRVFRFSPFQIQDQIKNKGVLNFNNSSKIVWEKTKQNKKQSSLAVFNYPLSSVLSHVYYFLHLFYHFHPSVTCWVLSFLHKVWTKKSS